MFCNIGPRSQSYKPFSDCIDELFFFVSNTILVLYTIFLTGLSSLKKRVCKFALKFHYRIGSCTNVYSSTNDSLHHIYKLVHFANWCYFLSIRRMY